MDETSIDALLEYLKEMAATISSMDRAELQIMKTNLDEYVLSLTSKMPEQSRDIANREFYKCQVAAGDWIKIYCDSTFHTGDKADILREETMEFFFTKDERVIGVQKNFFTLGMIDEILTPSTPFTDQKRAAKIVNSRIKTLAREQGVTASYKTNPAPETSTTAGSRLWYFGDERNFLQSSEAGLTDEEALNYLLR